MSDKFQEIREQIEGGCGSHSCRIERPKGVGVNGPCRCWVRFEELRPIVQSLLERNIALEEVAEAAIPVRNSIMSEVKTVNGIEACNLDDALANLEK